MVAERCEKLPPEQPSAFLNLSIPAKRGRMSIDPREPSAEPSPQRPGKGGIFESETAALDRALVLVEYLRANCSWDRAQTARTLVPHLLEEVHETVDAIHSEDGLALRGELGDLLLNLAFQIVVGEESGHFTREEVVRGLEEKMIRRHPHLFGEGAPQSWESIKAAERSGGSQDESVLEGLAKGLDPLLKAHRIQERVSGVGFDWDEPGGALEKVHEELEEVRGALDSGSSHAVQEEIGDLLFSVVNLARLVEEHAAVSLERANAKFERRFRALETLAELRGVDLRGASLEELDVLWEEVKDRG